MKFFKFCFIAAMTLTLTACGAHTHHKQSTGRDLSGPTFNQALALQYSGFSIYQSERGSDWLDSDLFEAKARKSAQDQRVLPENPKDWDVPVEDATLLGNEYQNLMRALNHSRDTYPRMSARAQAAFDCWVEQEAQDGQPRHIQACRRTYYTAMYTIADRTDGHDGKEKRSMHSGDEYRSMDMGAAANNVFFDFNSVALSETEMRTVRNLARQFMRSGADRLLLVGHTDSSGSANYNRRLSRERAQAVADAFTSLGVSSGKIAIRAAGERRPMVETGDGAKERQNRRVTIQFQEKVRG